jgi:hypothetical protein
MTATKRISFKTMAVVPTTRTDAPWMFTPLSWMPLLLIFEVALLFEELSEPRTQVLRSKCQTGTIEEQ